LTQTATNATPTITPSEEQVLEEMRRKLDRTVLAWRKDGCLPPRYMRLRASADPAKCTGVVGITGVVSIVDSRVGGFNDNCHWPEFIGWHVFTGARGIVSVHELRDSGVRASVGMKSATLFVEQPGYGPNNRRISDEAKAALFRLAFKRADEALVHSAIDLGWAVKGVSDFSAVRAVDGGEEGAPNP
jgi:hypothetical protein